MSTSDTPLTDGILARLGPGDGSARMYERNVWLHHARTIEGLLYQARHQLENSQAYSKKLDGLIEEVGGCTFSCINPYEDLKAALIGLKKKTSDLEDVLAEHGWNRIEHPATFLRRLSPAGPTDAERDKGELPLCDYDLNCISAAIFRAFYNDTPPYGSKHSQNAINGIMQKAFAEAQVNPNRPTPPTATEGVIHCRGDGSLTSDNA